MKRLIIIVASIMMPLYSYADVPVTENNFLAAETEHYMKGWVDRVGDN